MKLRAGVIGLGVGEAHAEALLRHPEIELAAVCDFDAEKLARSPSASTPSTKATALPEDILADPSLHLVVVASWDNFHHRQVLDALRNGKHVFVEKPLCQTEDEANEIWEALAANPKLRLSSNFILRRYPRFEKMKNLIEQKALGQVYLAEGSYNYGRIEKITGSWRGEIPYYSVMAGGGLHIIDVLQWLVTNEIVEVSAFGTRLATKDTSFRFDDTVSSIVRFANGALGQITANFPCVLPHSHQITIYGTNGTLQNSSEELRRWSSRDEETKPETVSTDRARIPKGTLLNEFVDSLLGKRTEPIPAAEVFQSLAVCFAIERSVRERKTVPVRRFG